MMITRSYHVGIIDQIERQRLYINYGRRGWRNEEPLDSVITPESPRLLKRSIEALVKEGVRSKQQILSDLAMPSRAIEEICSLDDGYFSSTDTEKKAIPTFKGGIHDVSDRGNVVQLFGEKNK